MLDWFRSWHGAPTDAKWLLIGKRAGAAPGMVSAVVWALLDHASQTEERGDVAGFDFETYAIFSGFDEDKVRAIYAALEAKEIIVSGRIAQWDKRQPKREDSSVERMRRKREPQPQLPLQAAPIEEQESTTAAEKDDPPAAEPEPLIAPEAIALANEIAVVCGHDLEFLPPAWPGAANFVHQWLKKGWQRPIILESVRAQLAHKRDGPPSSINYFTNGIQRAHAPRSEVSHAKGGNGGGFVSIALDHSRQAREDDDLAGRRNASALRVIDGSGHS